MKQSIDKIFTEWNKSDKFSGVFSVSNKTGVIYEKVCGYRNRAEKIPNLPDTAFAIASGTKLFTALSACKLIDEGKLNLNDRIWDILPQDLKMISKEITVFHLLTHTSGIGDYIDEETMIDSHDILKLYDTRPVHKWERLDFYLPMINGLPQKFSPGERTCYSNSGFILLGLVIESVSKKQYQEFVRENIINPLGLAHTGFYRMNNLPGNTAMGYVYDEARREYITNVLYMPIVGGSDGGIFTSAADMSKLWEAVFNGKIFTSVMLERFLTKHGKFGLGVYIREVRGKNVYYTVGGDFGVDFFSAYFPGTETAATALGNTEMDTGSLLKKLFEIL